MPQSIHAFITVLCTRYKGGAYAVICICIYTKSLTNDDVSGVKSRFKEIVAQVSDVVTKGCMDPTCARAANAGSRTFQA